MAGKHRIVFGIAAIASASVATACGTSSMEASEVTTSAVEAPCAGSSCGTAREESQATVSCPQGQVISDIRFASYGTPTGSCGSFSKSSCHAANSISIVKSRCVGKASCSVDASNSVFGDPCVGTIKTVAIDAICSTSGRADASTSAPDGGAGGGGGVVYGTEKAPFAADDPINTRYTGTPGRSAGFIGSKFSAHYPSATWAIPVYYEREYINQPNAVRHTVKATWNRDGFGTSVSFWAPKNFHAQVGTTGTGSSTALGPGSYSDAEATVVRVDGSIVNFFALGGREGGVNYLPTSCWWFDIAGINQSGMRPNVNQWRTGQAAAQPAGLPGPRYTGWATNMGLIDGYFMAETKPFRGLIFIVDFETNEPRNCGHATYNYAGVWDGKGVNTGICEGQHFVIPRTTPKPTNLTPEGSYLWDVFVEYGAYDADSGSNELEIARPIPGSSVPAVTQTQMANINKDIAILFNNLHFAND